MKITSLNDAYIKIGDKCFGKDEKDPLRIIDIRPRPVANSTRSTLASGIVIYDSKVVMPTEIICKCALVIDEDKKWVDALKSISDIYNKTSYAKDRSDYATIVSRINVYTDCILLRCPHAEGADSADIFYFDLNFSQMIFIGENGIVRPKAPEDKDSVYIGNV